MQKNFRGHVPRPSKCCVCMCVKVGIHCIAPLTLTKLYFALLKSFPTCFFVALGTCLWLPALTGFSIAFYSGIVLYKIYNPDEAREVNVVKYCRRDPGSRAVWLLRHLPRPWDICGSSHRLVWDCRALGTCLWLPALTGFSSLLCRSLVG